MLKEIEIGSVNAPNLINVSFSELKTFRRCTMQHHYKYILNLKKKAKSLPLERGTIIHKCLEALYTTGEWKPTLKEYKKEFNKLFDEEKELYGDLPKEVFRLMRGYCNCYKHDRRWKVLGVEVPFKCRLPNSRVVLNGVIDLIVQDRLGLWVVEHKTHKNIPSNDYRMTEVQSTLYFYVLSQCFKGFKEEAMGIIFNYIRTNPPTIPKLLKNGKLSKAKIDTDRSTYLAAIKKHGLNKEDYRDILDRLSYKTYFSRHRVPRPDELVRNIVGEAIITGHLIEPYKNKQLLPDRTILMSCNWDCEFYQLCYAKLHGHDVEYLMKAEYEEREAKNDKEKT